MTIAIHDADEMRAYSITNMTQFMLSAFRRDHQRNGTIHVCETLSGEALVLVGGIWKHAQAPTLRAVREVLGSVCEVLEEEAS